jgi:ABC-type transport system involved in multi-copper enzyme maturation permease subunit
MVGSATTLSAVVRYTLIDLARRRELAGLVVLEVLLLSVLSMPRLRSGLPVLVESFGLFMALVIGACALRPELESGALALLWSRPLRRPAFAAGKLIGAACLLVAAIGAAAVLALPVTALFGGHPRQLAGAFALAAPNAALVTVWVMLFSTRWNGPVAALLGFVLFEAAGAVSAARTSLPGLPSLLLYEVLPHRLVPAWLGPLDLAGWALYVGLAVWLIVRHLNRLEP